MTITFPDKNSIVITHESGNKTQAIWAKDFVFVLYYSPTVRNNNEEKHHN